MGHVSLSSRFPPYRVGPVGSQQQQKHQGWGELELLTSEWKSGGDLGITFWRELLGHTESQLQACVMAAGRSLQLNSCYRGECYWQRGRLMPVTGWDACGSLNTVIPNRS